MKLTTTKVASWFRTVACAGLLGLSLVATTASADQPYQTRDAMSQIDSQSSGCYTTAEGPVCGSQTLSVMIFDKKTTQVCLIMDGTLTLADGSQTRKYESGCTLLPKHAFTLDAGLAGASLSPTELTIVSADCGEEFCGPEYGRVVTVAGDWTGTGQIDYYDMGETFESDGCTFKYGGATRQRSAQSQVSIDGMNGTGGGWMYTSEFTAKVHCKK